MVQLLRADVCRRPDHHRLETEVAHAPTHLGDGRVYVLERDDADAVQTRGRHGAVVAQPVVVRATRGAEHVGFLDPGEHRGGVEDGDVDALVVHVDETRGRVV